MTANVGGHVPAPVERRQAEFLQGTGVAVLARLDPRSMDAGKIVVHLIGRFLGLLPQIFGQIHPVPSSGLAVEDRATGNLTNKHFLQRHRLSAELQTVGIAGFGGAALVLHRQRLPQPFVPLECDPVRGGTKLHHIAVAGQPQPVADNVKVPNCDKIPALFPHGIIVAALVQQAAFGGAQVFGLLLFQVDQRPLPSAEAEVLDAGHLQVVLPRHHDSLWQVTPSGSVSSSQTL